MLDLDEILRNFSYKAALYVLEKYEPKFALLPLFHSGENSFTRQQLRAALEQLQSKFKAEKTNDFQEKRQIFMPVAAVIDEQLKPVIEARKQLYFTWRDLHSQLKIMVKNPEKFSNEQRGEIAIQILDTEDEIAEMWAVERYFNEHKKLPEAKQKIKVEIAGIESIQRRLMTIRSYISKAKKGILKAEKLPGLEAERNELEKQLMEYDGFNEATKIPNQ